MEFLKEIRTFPIYQMLVWSLYNFRKMSASTDRVNRSILENMVVHTSARSHFSAGCTLNVTTLKVRLHWKGNIEPKNSKVTFWRPHGSNSTVWMAKNASQISESDERNTSQVCMGNLAGNHFPKIWYQRSTIQAKTNFVCALYLAVAVTTC